jgi:hypothetical protein
VVVKAPGQNVQNVQDAVGGIQAPEEQHKPEQQNAPDPEDTVPHTTVGDPGVQDVQLEVHHDDDPADEIRFADCHHQKWFQDDGAIMRDSNGTYHYCSWSQKTPTDTNWCEGYNVDASISRLDVFLMMFPPKQLTSIVLYTNSELELLNKRKTSKS